MYKVGNEQSSGTLAGDEKTKRRKTGRKRHTISDYMHHQRKKEKKKKVWLNKVLQNKPSSLFPSPLTRVVQM